MHSEKDSHSGKEVLDHIQASRKAYALARRQNQRPRTVSDPLHIAVLISGEGTNLQAMIDQIHAGTLPVKIELVISSRPEANGLKRAAHAKIPVMSLNKDIYKDPQVADDIIATECKQHHAEYIVMAGYMRYVGADVLDSFPDHVINLHPSLLPSFPGPHAVSDALRAGVKVTGATVHFANQVYDGGAIIAQKAVAICEGDTEETLMQRIHQAEHALYPWVLRRIAAGDVTLDTDAGIVHITGTKSETPCPQE